MAWYECRRYTVAITVSIVCSYIHTVCMHACELGRNVCLKFNKSLITLGF